MCRALLCCAVMWYEGLLKGSQDKAVAVRFVSGSVARKEGYGRHSIRGRVTVGVGERQTRGQVMGKRQQALQQGRRNVRRPLSTILEFPKREPRPF